MDEHVCCKFGQADLLSCEAMAYWKVGMIVSVWVWSCSWKKACLGRPISTLFMCHTRCEVWPHRVDRVLSFFSSRPHWHYPHPLTRRRVCRPPPLFDSGDRGVPIPTRGQTLWYSRYICTLCVSGPDLVEKVVVQGVGPEYQGEQDERARHARLKYKWT